MKVLRITILLVVVGSVVTGLAAGQVRSLLVNASYVTATQCALGDDPIVACELDDLAHARERLIEVRRFGALTARHESLYGGLDELYSRLSDADYQSQRLYRDALAALGRGDEITARSLMAEAVRIYPRRVEGLCWQQRQYEQSGESLAALRVQELCDTLQPLYELDPPWRIGEWVLIGYDLNESDLELPGDVQVTLYWAQERETGPVPSQSWVDASTSEWSTCSCGNRVFQVGRVTNLIGNGAFEPGLLVAPEFVYPDNELFGSFYREYYSCYGRPPYAHHQVIFATRGGTSTHCGQLVAPEGSGATSTGFRSKTVQTVPGEAFLMRGWVRGTADAHAAIGLSWLGEIGDSKATAYVGSDIHEAELTHYAGVLTAPPGVTATNPMLLNLNSAGQACFDNVALFSLALPER